MINRVTYKLADCRSEREAAFQLIYERYLDAGLIDRNKYGIRVTPFHLLDTTDVIVAQFRGKVISTVSLIGDARLGLQMEAIYPSEIKCLRQQGLRLAEVSCLATRSKELLPSQMFDVFVNVVAFTIQLARYQQVERLLIAIHPDRESFYRRLLGFCRVGAEKSYPAVRGKLAVACGHDFTRLDRQHYPLYDLVYEESYQAAQLQRKPMDRKERQYFRQIIDSMPMARDEEFQWATCAA